jgi:isochorismate synthase
MIDFFIKVKQQHAQNLPFVIYKKPDKKTVVGLFQKNDHLYFAEDFTETGFVFAPFDGNQIILMPKKQSVKWESIMSSPKKKQDLELDIEEDAHAKAHFEALVQKGIDGIARGLMNKVVLSREEIVDVPRFDIVATFKKVIKTYSTAFCYCWFHPKIGLWIGATPERLLKADKKQFYTMALAGTQKVQDSSEVVWEKKEMEEQQFVTDFIVDNLKGITSEVSISSPYTLKAGNVVHIKTDIEGVIHENSNLKQVVSVLHPTPAVCGLPKTVAKDFILENEEYDRGYYTGFLGELNKKGFMKLKLKSDLFVNLRCMQITSDPDGEMSKAHLYMGCGITKDSVPEKEWSETVNKSMTMKRVLQK